MYFELLIDWGDEVCLDIVFDDFCDCYGVMLVLWVV